MTTHHYVEFSNESCIVIAKEQSVLNAALEAGIPIFHVCGGKANCSTCRVLVLEGNEHLSAPTPKEMRLNEKLHFPKDVRLACQTQVNGSPVKLRRIIQDEEDIGLYVGKGPGISTEQIGELKELTLFFLDIRNFTPYVETHLAFDIIHIIRKLFSVFQSIIESNGGKILETTGDGFYAIFPCDDGRAVSANSAVQSAFTIQTKLEELNETYLARYFDKPLQVGIGIHIGSVISGAIRLGKAEHTVVMGLPVNIASRLQNATKELNNSILVSSEVYRLLIHDSKNHPSCTINVKGVSEALHVYTIGKAFQR